MKIQGPYSSFFHLLVIFQESSLIFLGLYCTIWGEEIRLFLLVNIRKAFPFSFKSNYVEKRKAK